MPRLGALIRKEFLLLAHDRHGLAVLFLMPAVFILIMSLALRDAMDADAPGRVDYRLLAPGDGYAERALAQELADLLGPASTDADAILIDVPPGLADRIGERLAGSSTLLLSIRFDASVAAADRLPVDREQRVPAGHPGLPGRTATGNRRHGHAGVGVADLHAEVGDVTALGLGVGELQADRPDEVLDVGQGAAADVGVEEPPEVGARRL